MLDRIWKFFASLKPAGFIFTALVISTLIGSFVIQKPNAQEGQIERAYSPETIKLFEFFGFFDLFHSPWFAFLILLLAVNVICASIAMVPRHRKLFSLVDPLLAEAALRNQPSFQEGSAASWRGIAGARAAVANLLKKYFKRPEIIDRDGKTHFFVNKMRWGYFGVYVVHLGIIVIIAGGLRGSYDGYEGQLSLMEGETSDVVYVRNSLRRNKKLDFSIRADDVRIETYEDGSPKDYFSTLSVLDREGKVVKQQTIQVNDPLEYGGISFYQANYGKRKTNESQAYVLKRRDKKTGKEITVEIPEDANRVTLASGEILEVSHYNENPVMPSEEGPVELGETLRFSITRGKAKPEFVTVFKDYPDIDKMLRPKAKEEFVFTGRRENYELKEVTGLQVAYDPGAPIVFLGCAIMMIGIYWAFFTSHQKIWLTVDGDRWLLAGKTYRNPLAFKGKFARLAEDLANLQSIMTVSEQTKAHEVSEIFGNEEPA